MKQIELIGRGRGLFVLVDDGDFELVAVHRWRLLTPDRALTAYAVTLIAGRTVLMHRLILNPPTNVPIDHIDGSGLNNQRSNLRLVSHSENVRFGVARRAFDFWESEL